jgi:hypothetical protein
MKRSEIKKAVQEQWRVKDDFHSVGTIVAHHETSPDHIMVLWDGEKEPAIVHHDRATPAP